MYAQTYKRNCLNQRGKTNNAYILYMHVYYLHNTYQIMILWFYSRASGFDPRKRLGLGS